MGGAGWLSRQGVQLMFKSWRGGFTPQVGWFAWHVRAGGSTSAQQVTLPLAGHKQRPQFKPAQKLSLACLSEDFEFHHG